MAESSWRSVTLVREVFRRYYLKEPSKVRMPHSTSQREFGFLSFEGKAMFRHISLVDKHQLHSYLIENAPAHVYYSSAYYKVPEAEMELKGWLGADLVFDIDADHIDSPCKASHDRWRCKACGEEGRGRPLELCPKCGKAVFEEETWLCERCLEAAKYEAQKLLDILIQDFDFSSSTGELEVNFSGNRGYHVHVRSHLVKRLSQIARREIVDYVMGVGINPKFQGFGHTWGMRRASPKEMEKGWRGRSFKAIYDYISNASMEDLKSIKIDRETIFNLLNKREEILSLLIERSSSSILGYISEKALNILLEAAVKEHASAIDTVVTTDIHRLIRLSNTLHGKTGWLAQNVNIDDLDDYDPLTRAIALKDETEKVFVRWAPKFRIGDKVYGPYDEELVKLPLAAAVFLLCKNAAKVER